jgi:hypothetical protein
MRNALPLVLGLVVGSIGAVLFQRSFPPKPGTSEARVAELETRLKSANVRLAALEAAAPPKRPNVNALKAGTRGIVEDFREGRLVDVNEVFRTFRPVFRDLAPLFDRIRRKELKQSHERVHDHLTRKYHLDASQQAALKKWQEAQADTEAKVFRALATSESITLEDMIKASQAPRRHTGLDRFMEGLLTGDDLNAFKSDRMTERVENVQNEAEQRVSRLHREVELDESQQDQIFAIMARSSPDFDPAMRFEGLGDDTAALAPGQSRHDAIMAVLRPDQRQQYEERRAARRREAEIEFNELGLKLPDTWDLFADD